MTDDRNGGGVPPGSDPAAPPPLASAPPPTAPHYPPPPHQPPPPYYPPPQKSKTGLWILGLFLAFALGVGGTLLVLYLSDEIVSYRSSSYPAPSHGGSTGIGTSSTRGTSSGTTAPTPAPTTSGGSPPTADTLTGTWGPRCPGAPDDAITFYSDGSAASDGERGTWSLDGPYVNLNNGRETMSLYWEMLGSDSARVRRSGDSRTRVIYRCP